jgi:hypothetical protein
MGLALAAMHASSNMSLLVRLVHLHGRLLLHVKVFRELCLNTMLMNWPTLWRWRRVTLHFNKLSWSALNVDGATRRLLGGRTFLHMILLLMCG